MKRLFLAVIAMTYLVAISATAAPKPIVKAPAFPATLANARFVYVDSYDGDQFDPDLLPQDRDAINAVEDSIHNWGKLILVYEPSQADIIILVTSRPSEDLLAVYDAHEGTTANYLWRVTGRNGLQSGEAPL